ncbi:MAG: T9SS type A sorting domain-containing protein [Ignavibacteria bacterium]
MKKLILLVCFLVPSIFTSTGLFAQFVEENFDYPVGDPITLHGWTSNGNPNALLVVAPGLEFPCYVGSGIGNALALNTNGPDASKFLSSKITSGSAYVSCMVRFSAAQTGDYFLSLGDSTTNFSSEIGRVYAKDSAGKIAFGLNKAGNNNEIYTPAQYFLNTTYVVLLKYTFVPGANNDLVSLFVFNDCPPLFEPLPTLGPMGLGINDLPHVGKVTVVQGAASKAPTLIIDGIYADRSYENSALPVELTSFYSNVVSRNVVLKWTTETEINNSEFIIERSLVNGEWLMIGNVSGNGTTSSSHSYSYTDRGLNSGNYNYRLKQIDYNGNFEYFNLSNEVVIGIPESFNLSQNYPNPFNPSTRIDYDINVDGKVSLKLLDMSGKEVASLVNEIQTAGYYSIILNADNLSSGIYFYTINVAGSGKNFLMTKKMMLVK